MSALTFKAGHHSWPGGATALVLGGAALLAVAAVAATAAHGLVQPGYAIAFGLLMMVGEVARVRLPGDRELAPVGVAGAYGYALTFAVGRTPATHSVLQVIAVTACATLAGAVPHVVAGRPARLDGVARRIFVAATAAAIARPFLEGTSNQDGTLVLTFVGIAILAGAVDAFFAAMVRLDRDATRFWPTLRDEARALVGIGAAMGSTGVLIALSAKPLGLWALLVFSVPLLVTQFSFRRYAAIRATYLQTIRALSRVTEVGGYVEPGHSRRVSTLSVAVGRELGVPEADLLELEYAALMHDIGQLSFADPIPGGSTIVVAPAERRRIAELGAEIIRTTGTLDRVADIVERQADAYRRPRQGADETLPLGSRVIKAVNAYDDLVGTSGDPSSSEDALERLRLGMAFEYDPAVVEALARVLARFNAPVRA